LKGRYHTEDVGTGGKVILERILGKLGGRMRIGCIWLRIGKNGELL
jgi:hypothetical protein